MATMTHPSTTMPGARRYQLPSAPGAAATKSISTVDVSEMKGSLLYAIGICVGILGVSLATVLMPALGPPSEEAATLIHAKQVQASAQEYLVLHPEAAIPAGDERAWGFLVPEASTEDTRCPEYWVGSAGIC